MTKITVDGKTIEVPEGSTVLEAAAAAGAPVRSLCLAGGVEPQTSCMVCLVRLGMPERIAPSCGLTVTEGMEVTTDSAEIRRLRKRAVELLLGEHIGDCLGPCEVTCPAGMDIPRMIRLTAAGDERGAIRTVKAAIPIPAILGRICPAPCEAGCRRKLADGAVSICLLKKYVADVDLRREEPFMPERRERSGRHIAVIGGGPAGLSAAWFALERGHECTLFEKESAPGGALRGIDDSRLEQETIDAEAATIAAAGAKFVTGSEVAELDEVRGKYDAVILACGELDAEGFHRLGLRHEGKRVRLADDGCMTELDGVFAAGAVKRPLKMAVRAVADAAAAVDCVDRYLAGEKPSPENRPFNSTTGRPSEEELETFMQFASPEGRHAPESEGFSAAEAVAEADRCLHCDCRKKDDCRLREAADATGARPLRSGRERPPVTLDTSHPEIIYEEGKCIRCGVCVTLAGQTFIGRGYDMRPGAAFGEEFATALAEDAISAARLCPTGAISLREEREDTEE